LDHPPTPEELAEIYKRQEENDPRSVFYKRTLIRPRIPVGWLIAFFLVGSLTFLGIYIGIEHVSDSGWLAVLCAIVGVCLLGLLFAKQLLIAAVKTYQALAPKHVRERCRYEPSCSVYMIQAVEKYGFWRGFRRGMRRWKGCKPPNGGIDLP